MPTLSVQLKPDREESLLKRHHWIFSGAIDWLPEDPDGAILPVYSSRDELLGHAFFNRRPRTIWGRMLSFGPGNPMERLESLLDLAIERRKTFVKRPGTSAFRLINAEGDRLSGLIVDQYGDYLVMQIQSLGMERLKKQLVERLVEKLKPKGILERSSGPSRREEGLEDQAGILYGEVPRELTIEEGGHSFLVDPFEGQKTGFFLDQRELRGWLQENVRGRSLLNLFSYTGGFTIYGFAGGATSALSLDSSERAMQTLGKNLELNGFQELPHRAVVDDAFRFLQEEPLPFNAVVLDPPAMIKRKNDFQAGCRAYYELNRLVLAKIPPRSLFISCSCSHFLEEPLFLKIIEDAARRSGRELTLLHRHGLQADHPINPAHGESSYLKGLAFFVL